MRGMRRWLRGIRRWLRAGRVGGCAGCVGGCAGCVGGCAGCVGSSCSGCASVALPQRDIAPLAADPVEDRIGEEVRLAVLGYQLVRILFGVILREVADRLA